MSASAIIRYTSKEEKRERGRHLQDGEALSLALLELEAAQLGPRLVHVSDAERPLGGKNRGQGTENGGEAGLDLRVIVDRRSLSCNRVWPTAIEERIMFITGRG